MYRTQGAFIEDCSILAPRSRSCRRISEVAELPKRKIHKRSGKGHAAGGLGGRLAQAQRGPERPREVEREQTKPLMRLAGDDQAGSPQISVRNPNGSPRVLCPTMYVCTKGSNRNPLQTHKQNYDQGGSPQAELRPGSLPTSRITTRELAGWLALAGWLRPREAQRGPERRSVDRTSLSCAWLEAPEGLCICAPGGLHEPTYGPQKAYVYGLQMAYVGPYIYGPNM